MKITEIKTFLQRLDSSFEVAEERIYELDYGSIEIIQFEEQKEKKKKENKQAIRHLWDNIKHTNICMMGVQKKRTERKESKEYLKT